MTLTFKDVGQGDSLLIEWVDKEKEKVGIIDCKKKGRQNPVLDHLINKKYTEIEFIILSHPHSDHFSGFEELLAYAEKENIIIHRFGHTIREIGEEYFEWFEAGNTEKRQLARIIKQANALNDKGVLKKFVLPTEDWHLEITNEIVLHSFSPSHDEIKKFQNAVKLNSKANKKAASKAANYLSTVFHLRVGDTHLLLTSDAERETFDRLHSENRMNDKPIKLGQAPHHGSSNNYSANFWNNLETHKDKLAIFSAGVNDQCHHPHLEVIQSFRKNGYGIRATNIVNGMEVYAKQIRKKTLVLDTISDISEDHLIGGDKSFNY